MTEAPLQLTGTSYVVLALVQHLGSATPYDLKRAMERSTQSIWQVSHTTAYEEPARLAEHGLLARECELGGRRRKRYTLTGTGRDALRAWVERPPSAPPQLRDEALVRLAVSAAPEPLVDVCLAWHAAKLAELERQLGAVRDDGDAVWEPAGVERTLLAGALYHRKMIELIEELVRRLRPHEASLSE